MFSSFTSMIRTKSEGESSSTSLPTERGVDFVQDSLYESYDQQMNAADGQVNSPIYAQGDAKQVLGGLNDRLAIYIEKVRELERKNEHLVLKYRELELEKREIESRKTESKTLVNELRKQKEESDELRCRAEVSQKKAESEAIELRKQVKRRDQELEVILQDRDQLENRLSLVRNDLNLADLRNSKLEQEMSLMKQDLTTVFQQNEELKIQLGDEIVLRTELQRRIDYELHTYKSLLEEEESRLHIRTPDVSSDFVSEQNISTSTRVSASVQNQKEVDKFSDIKPGKRRRMASDE
jgi:chromosome segregation ATPase